MIEQIKKKKRDVNRTGYGFVAPFVVIFIAFSLYPVIRTLYLSFTDYKGYGEANFVFFDNYKRVLTDKFFWKSLFNTINIWALNIVVQIGLALGLTIIFSDIKYRISGLGFFRAVFYLPNLIAATSIAFLFKTLLDHKFGTVNQILLSSGIIEQGINWLGSSATAPMTIGLIGAWVWFGNTFIILMAGVMGISKDYFEAAIIDGAGRFKLFTSITIPLLKPILLYVGITSVIGGLQIFDLPFLITGGNPGAAGGSLQTVVMYMYKFGFDPGTAQVGYAAAIAYVLFTLILIVSIIQFRLFTRKEI